MSVVILIPARLASTRLPNKPLADIAGVPMVVRVAQQVSHLTLQGVPIRVVVAGDHVAGSYPATLEGAVQSGEQAARRVLGTLDLVA